MIKDDQFLADRVLSTVELTVLRLSVVCRL